MTNIYPILNDNDIRILSLSLREYAETTTNMMINALLNDCNVDVTPYIDDLKTYARIHRALGNIDSFGVEFNMLYLRLLDGMLWTYAEVYGEYAWQGLTKYRGITPKIMLTAYKLQRIIKNHDLTTSL